MINIEPINIFFISFASLIGVVVIFLLFLLIRYIVLISKGNVIAHFISKDRDSEHKRLRGVKDKIKYDETEYDYDDNVTIKRRGIKHIYYVVGVPKPLNLLDVKQNFLSYDDYKKVIKSKVLSDLLSDDSNNISYGEGILIAIVLGSALIILITLIVMNRKPDEILLNDALRQFIVDAVTQAIRG